ncbi:MAG TPA: C1 family peptidase, partial [Leptospiraceae bacterium]|nr:C1 family peptidase [Leptospiraceae bacterium]
MGFKDFISGKMGAGYKPMKPASNAKVYSKGKVKKLPPKVDLRKFMTPVENQKDTNSCTANAVAGACEYLLKQAMGKKAYDISRMFIYYNARAKTGDPIEDQGSVIQYAVESLQKLGACPEKLWTFDKAHVNKKPDKKAYEAAQKFKIKDKQSVPTDLQTMKEVLALGHPIIFGTQLFASFDECEENGGFVPMPSPKETGRESHGGHAMLIVGYSDPDKVFIVRNSWGKEWGDKGYCYMPYNYLANEKLTGDCWSLISTAGEKAEKNAKKAWSKDKKKSFANKPKTKTYKPEEYEGDTFYYYFPEDEIWDYSEEEPEDYSSMYDEYYDPEANYEDWDDAELEEYAQEDGDFVPDEDEPEEEVDWDAWEEEPEEEEPVDEEEGAEGETEDEGGNEEGEEEAEGSDEEGEEPAEGEEELAEDEEPAEGEEPEEEPAEEEPAEEEPAEEEPAEEEPAEEEPA